MANRICVALSRAKHGLYCMGNLEMLSQSSVDWSQVVMMARARGLLNDGLPVTCGQHAHNDMRITLPRDFERRPDGGCQLVCGERLQCGHVCTMHCHPLDREHAAYVCSKTCPKRMAKCGHYCQMPCSHPGECVGCGVLVNKRIKQCGHIVKIRFVPSTLSTGS